MSKLDELAAAESGETELPAPDAPADPEAEATAAPPEPEPERLYAGKYKTPEAMEEAYRNAEQELGRVRHEIGQLRNQPPPAQQQPAQQELMTREQLEEAYDSDPIGVTSYLARIAAAEVAAAQSRQLEPIIHSVHDQNARSVWNQLQTDYGAKTVEAHKEALSGLIGQDAEFYSDPQTQLTRLRMALDSILYKSHQTVRQGEPQPPRDERGRFAEGDVHMEGGSTPAPPRNTQESEVDPIIQAMRKAAPRSDLFGPVPDVTHE